MGIATTAEYDDLLARGYPHLRRLIADHPHDEDSRAWAQKALAESDPITYFVDWPAEVARRWIRGYATARISQDDPELDRGGPIDEREGKALLAGLFHPKHDDGYTFRAQHGAFLLEAILGTEVYVEAALAEFEKLRKLDGEYDTRHALGYALGFQIRRLPAGKRAAAVKRIAALVDKHPDGITREFLSYVVGGTPALVESGRTPGPYCVHFADPATIIQSTDNAITSWDAQHVYLAGEAMLDALAANLKKLSRYEKPWVIDQLAILASPKAVAILKELGKTKLLAPRVEAALAARPKAAKKPAKTKKKK